MIKVISWSKDRPAQLDLTLSSLKKYFVNWREIDINIIYLDTTENYKKGYELVQKYHPEFNYIRETNFRQNT
jgi:3'-phosphoadenosine 5'-phosphosulfate sulfotransferase (PAPS reductase)/FAD synthetase